MSQVRIQSAPQCVEGDRPNPGTQRMKLFIFESHPVQYHAPVYRELHRLCNERRIASIRVFYATDVTLRGHFDTGFCETVAWDEPLLEHYPASVLHLENGVPLNGFGSLSA